MSLKLISWNVNGIRACDKKGLREFVEREDPDIFCVQETKAHVEQVDSHLVQLHAGHSYWSSAQRRGYSGTATFCKSEALNFENGIGIPDFDSEGRFTITTHKDFTLYNIYFPNGSAREERHLYKQEFLQALKAHLEPKVVAGEKIIVVGDYNIAHREIDIHDPLGLAQTSGFLPEERAWFDEFLSMGFVDTFRRLNPEERERYTWWSYRERARIGNRGWRIDYICITENLLPQLKVAEVWDQQLGSDHCPVMVELV